MVLLDKYHPTRGASPAFLFPPQVFVLLTIEAAFLLILLPDMYTIL
jgi:hypothetical protein